MMEIGSKYLTRAVARETGTSLRGRVLAVVVESVCWGREYILTEDPSRNRCGFNLFKQQLVTGNH